MYFYAERGKYIVTDKSQDNLFVIYDFEDKIFFIRNMGQGDNIFNVNFDYSGMYYSDNIFSMRPVKQVYVSNISLPDIEYNAYKPFVFLHKYDEDCAAYILHEKRDGMPSAIVLGKKYKSAPQPYRLFYILHEIGHFFYDTEKYCDLFALAMSDKLGYDRENIFYAMTNTLNLSDNRNIDRINFISQYID